MKNVISVIVDSVYSECLGTGRTEISSTPFIDTLIQEGLYAPNTYSFGPYTDAATKGLYCFEPTLDNYGFYFSINAAHATNFQVFMTAGYETIAFYYPYYLLSKKTSRYIDHSVFTSGFLFESVWNGKYKYYSERYANGLLEDIEWELLIMLTDMLFDSWLQFYQDVAKNPLSGVIISKMKDVENDGYSKLEKEFEIYLNDRKEYIKILLKQGMKHKLAYINDYDFDKRVDCQFLDQKVMKKYAGFFRKIYSKNIRQNIRNRNVKLWKVASSIKFFFTRKNEDVRYMINTGLLLASTRLMKKRMSSGNWQLNASANKQVEVLIDILKNREKNKPFYVSIHVEEPHHNVSFFSYDSTDEKLIKEEVEYLTPLVDNCGKTYKGNLMYQLSLRYTDLCIKRLFDYLRASGLDDNTTVLIVADHGTSYSFNPIRNSVTNNFYDENYHIPLLVWSKGMNQMRVNGFYNSADVFPTLFDIVGISSPVQTEGMSVLKQPQGRQYVIHEYTGPGCPDMLSKEIWIAVRSTRYLIGYKVKLAHGMKIHSPDEVYDLEKDPKQLKNVNTSFNELYKNSDFKMLVNAAETRFRDIMKQTKEFICHLDSFSACR